MPEGQQTEAPPQPTIPKYRCHKIVSALEIGSSEWNGDATLTIAPRDDAFAPITLDEDTAKRFKRMSDDDTGYYVIYEDGYVSWSPAQVFRDGYTEILVT